MRNFVSEVDSIFLFVLKGHTLKNLTLEKGTGLSKHDRTGAMARGVFLKI